MSKSQLLVIIQFTCLLGYPFTGRIFADNKIFFLIEILGVALAIWAIYTMRPIRVSIFPEPRSDNKMVETGPYAVIRHPMYTAILMVAFALSFDRMDAFSGVLLLVLTVNQVIKLRYEEGLLLAKHEGYAAYMKRTKALIPFVW